MVRCCMNTGENIPGVATAVGHCDNLVGLHSSNFPEDLRIWIWRPVPNSGSGDGSRANVKSRTSRSSTSSSSSESE